MTPSAIAFFSFHSIFLYYFLFLSFVIFSFVKETSVAFVACVFVRPVFALFCLSP